MEPPPVGAKLMGSVQEDATPSIPGDPEPLAISGQVPALLLSSVKFGETLGLLPVPGTGKASAALPRLKSVAVCGESELTEPSFVEAKVNICGAETSSLINCSAPLLEMYRFPWLSIFMKMAPFRLVTSVLRV